MWTLIMLLCLVGFTRGQEKFKISTKLSLPQGGCEDVYQWWNITPARNIHSRLKTMEGNHCRGRGSKLLNFHYFQQIESKLQFERQRRTIYIADEVANKTFLVHILPAANNKSTIQIDLVDLRLTVKDITYQPTHFVCVSTHCLSTTQPPAGTWLASTPGSKMSASIISSFSSTMQHPTLLQLILALCAFLAFLFILVLIGCLCRLRSMRSELERHKMTIKVLLLSGKTAPACEGNIERRRLHINRRSELSLMTSRDSVIKPSDCEAKLVVSTYHPSISESRDK